jgi:hypothetical protein
MNFKILARLIFLTAIFLLISVSVYCQQDTILTKDEIVELKTVAQQYQTWKMLNIVGGAVLVICTLLGVRHIVGKWAEDKAMEKLAGKLDVQKEVLQGTLAMMVKEYQLKQRKILVVGASNEMPLQLSEFLGTEGFSLLDYKSITSFRQQTTLPTDIKLLLFNYLNKDVKKHQAEIIPLLTQFIEMRMLLLGTGRLEDDQKETIGNRLSFSNGYDTLTDRILGAYKQPI